jgi:hypothetical protein
MNNAWANNEAEGGVFNATPEGFKQRCYTFFYILSNGKDTRKAGTYLAPDCDLVHEDNPPVKGAEAFLPSGVKP